MSPLLVAAVVAVTMAAAIAAIIRVLRPPRRSLEHVRALLHPVELTRPVPGDEPRRALAGALAPLARWIERSMGDGLRFVDVGATDVASRVAVSVVGGMFAIACAASALVTLGLLPPSPLWIVLAIAAGGAGGCIVWNDVRHHIERRRREFRRTANDFVQLVAVGLTTDQSVEEAVHFALSVGDSDVFDLLRSELATAPLRGVPLWEPLDQLGRRFEQRELSELGNSIERQGTQGVSITETVTTLATAMRERTLDDLEREADKVNANLAGPTISFVVTTMVFLAYPLAIRIGGAFGG